MEFDTDQFLIAISGGSLIVIKNWQLEIKIENTSMSNEMHWLAMMPGFHPETFPFCVGHGTPTFNLINVKLGYNEILIKSPEQHYFG